MTLTLRTFMPRLTSVVSALALSITALTVAPTPARANDDVLLKFLLGAAGVAVLVHAFSDRERPRNRTYSRNTLPDYCREKLRVNRRDVTVYNARCLQDAGLRNLPHQCHEYVRTNRGARGIYRERCLVQAGYQRERPQARNQPRHRATPWHDRGPQSHRLPQHCSLTYTYRGQRLPGYSADCLDRAGYRNLPETCILRGSQSGAQVRIYSAQCLQGQNRRR